MKKILVVEDEQLLREIYVIALNSAGYTVTAANDGLEAIGMLEESVPDLILLDLLMPKLDGLGFLRETNLTVKYPNIKVILFSNMSSSAKVEEAINLGVSKHIIKSSLTPKQLLLEVKSVLSE